MLNFQPSPCILHFQPPGGRLRPPGLGFSLQVWTTIFLQAFSGLLIAVGASVVFFAIKMHPHRVFLNLKIQNFLGEGHSPTPHPAARGRDSPATHFSEITQYGMYWKCVMKITGSSISVEFFKLYFLLRVMMIVRLGTR